MGDGKSPSNIRLNGYGVLWFMASIADSFHWSILYAFKFFSRQIHLDFMFLAWLSLIPFIITDNTAPVFVLDNVEPARFMRTGFSLSVFGIVFCKELSA